MQNWWPHKRGSTVYEYIYIYHLYEDSHKYLWSQQQKTDYLRWRDCSVSHTRGLSAVSYWKEDYQNQSGRWHIEVLESKYKSGQIQLL